MKNFNFIMSVLFLIFGLIMASLAFYKSEFIHQGQIRSHFFNYYIFSFFVIILVISLQIFTKKIRTNIFLILISCSIGFTFFETLLEFKVDKLLLSDVKAFKNPYSHILKNENKKDHIPRILPGSLLPNGLDDVYFPASSISLKNTVMCEESSGMISYLSDRYGFNNDDIIWDKEITATLIGDSFVHGDCVSREKTISGNLNHLANKYFFLNLGMGGNGPLLKLLSLREFGFVRKTKNILWFYFEGNDFIELEFESSSRILSSYLYDAKFTQNLSSKTQNLDKKFLTIHNKIMKNQKFPNFLLPRLKNILVLKNIRGLLSRLSAQDLKEGNFNIDKYEKILIKAKEFSLINKANFYFIYLPTFERFSDSQLIHDEFLNKRVVINTMKANDIKVIDISNLVFETSQDPLEFFPDRKNGHYNEKGYREIAKKLIEILKFN